MKRYVFIVLAIAALSVSEMLIPSKAHGVGGQNEFDLASIAPQRIGEWQAIDAVPDVALGDRKDKGLSAALYEDVLMRTYRRSRDGAVMWLVVAYGGDQRGSYTVHLPELCYRSFGFEIEPHGSAALQFGETRGEVRQLLAHSNDRVEPISYWVVMGGDVVTGQFNVKLRELWNGLTAKHESGTLVRVSMPIDGTAADAAYAEQQNFIQQLVGSWPQTSRRLVWPVQQG
jgi:EpsI family protein